MAKLARLMDLVELTTGNLLPFAAYLPSNGLSPLIQHDLLGKARTKPRLGNGAGWVMKGHFSPEATNPKFERALLESQLLLTDCLSLQSVDRRLRETQA